MKYYILRLLILTIAVVIQTTLLPSLSIEQAKPDILLIIILFFGLRGGTMTGQLSGFFGGLIEDAFLHLHGFGVNTLVKTIIGYFSGKLQRNFNFQAFIPIFVLGMFATIVKGILVILVIWIIYQEPDNIFIYIINELSLEILINALIAPFIFIFLGKFNFGLYIRED